MYIEGPQREIYNTILHNGMIINTNGYYSKNDGGGATYLITNTDNVLFVDSTLPITVNTKTPVKFEKIIRDCYKLENDVIPEHNWMGTSS